MQSTLLELGAAIKGQDIVVSTMGGMDLDVKTAHVVRAMEAAGASRIIAISAGGIYDELPEPFNTWDKGMVGETRPVNLRTADLIERSSLRHTILRPVVADLRAVRGFRADAEGRGLQGHGDLARQHRPFRCGSGCEPRASP